MNQIVLIYTTLHDQKTGQMVAQRLLEKKLIACANIFPPHIAVYEWDGNIVDDAEVAVIFKTSKAKQQECMAAIAELHHNECPAIVALESSDTNKPFFDWVNSQSS